jgi:thioredoxin 1
MARFGDLINVEVPVLLEFFTEWDETSKTMHPVVKDVAAALGDKAKIIKIDVEKNNELADALRIKGVPTFIIYKSGEMKWRQRGEESANTLINRVKKFL